MNKTFILLLGTGIANFFLTFLVYNRNKKSLINKSFALFLLNATLWPLAIAFFRTSTNPFLALFWARIIYISGTLVPASFLYFSYIVTKTKPPKYLRIISIISTIFFTVSLMFGNLFISGVQINSYGNIAYLSIANYLWILYFSVFMGLGAIHLFKKYKKSKGYEKIQLKFILISIIFPVLASLPFNIILPAFAIYQFIYIGPVGLLFMTLIITYAIIKHRFFDVRLIASRTVAYLLLLTTLGFIYSLGVIFSTYILFPQFAVSLNTQYLAISTILTLIASITFQPLRKYFEKITDNILYKNKVDTENLLQKLSKSIASTTSLNTLSTKALKAICSNIKISNSTLIFLEKGKILHTKSYKKAFDLENSDIKNIPTKKEVIVYDEIKESHPSKEMMRSHNISIIKPISLKNKTIALLILGPKKSGDMYYYKQDIDVLKIISPELAIAIQNALAYEKIKNFNKKLKEEVKQATEKLKKANKNLRHLDKLKDEFVYVATHELKNPVTAMKGYLSMIDEGSFGKIPKKLQAPIHQLNQSNQQLVKLVNDLLQIARTEAKTLSIDLQEVNICDIIEQVIESTRPLADQKKILINYVCLKKEIMVKADPERLKEVFNNLITNAIKYSEKGTITIKYAEEKDFVIVHVKDQGVGIAKKDQDKIFTRFFRVEEEAAKGIPGSGLGLFIVRQLVEKMGGKIWFSSKYGKGSTFSFSLPKVKKDKK